MSRTGTNNVSNKELVRVIHANKRRYCWILDVPQTEEDKTADTDGAKGVVLPADPHYDFETIIDNVVHIKNEAGKTIEEYEREGRPFIERLLTEGEVGKVYRVHTWEHIPIRKEEKQTRTKMQHFHEEVNFPPFKQFKVVEIKSGTGKSKEIKRELIEVVRSHWKPNPDKPDDVEAGEFSVNHPDPKITPEYVDLLYKMVNGIGSKQSWSGYPDLSDWKADAMCDLLKNGLKFDEVYSVENNKPLNPYSFIYTCVTNTFNGKVNKYNKMRAEEGTSYDVGEGTMDAMVSSSSSGAGKFVDLKYETEKRAAEIDAINKKQPVEHITPVTNPERWAEMQREYGDPDFKVEDITPEYIKKWKKRCKDAEEKRRNDPRILGKKESEKRRRGKLKKESKSKETRSSKSKDK